MALAPFRLSPDPRAGAPFSSDALPSAFVRAPTPALCPLADAAVPAFLVVRPLPPSASVPAIDCARADSPRCGTCRAYLSPFCAVPARAKSWRCPFCGHVNSTIHFTSLYDMRPASVERPELGHFVYDVLPPRSLDGRRGRARVFVLLVDEALLDARAPSCAELLAQLRRAREVALGNDQIAVMTFSECPSIANLTSQTARMLPEFNPGLLLPTLSKRDFFLNADSGFAAAVEFLSSLAHKDSARPSALFGALRWATAFMEGSGGRLILFTSGRATDPEINLLPQLLAKSISLSIFKRGTLSEIELWSQMTGGVVSVLSNFPPLASVFATGNAWAASAVMRTNQAAVVANVMGPCCRGENGVVMLPALHAGSSVIFELSAKEVNSSDFLFQVVVRFLDDENVQRIRVINGKIPFAKGFAPPLDEAAIALFLGRKRAYDRNERRFREQVGFVRRFLGPESLFPACAFAASVRDTTFALSASVEKLMLSIFPTTVEIDGVAFSVVWAPDFTVVFPRPDDAQAQVLMEAGRSVGAGLAEVFYPESEEEFRRVTLEAREAIGWIEEIPQR
jgi:hypothetical protein